MSEVMDIDDLMRRGERLWRDTVRDLLGIDEKLAHGIGSVGLLNEIDNSVDLCPLEGLKKFVDGETKEFYAFFEDTTDAEAHAGFVAHLREISDEIQEENDCRQYQIANKVISAHPQPQANGVFYSSFGE